MNQLEQRMVEILAKGRDQGIYVGVKAEFEAEGTRTEEMIRLSDITRRSGLKMAMKIGGCEAVRDLIDCKQLGADFIIAPMVESPYALSKYIQLKNRLYSPFERQHVQFLFNVETHTALLAVEELAKIASAKDGVNGIVFGRTDYSGSVNLPRDNTNLDQITEACVTAAKACRDHKLDFVVGGGMSIDSLDALRKIRVAQLTRFETRKIIFDAKSLDKKELAQAMVAANEFECLWLMNKRDYYSGIASEDNKRISMLEKRLEAAATQGYEVKRVA